MAIIDKPSDYFNTKLYTGTGSSLAITGVGFTPDWVWIKERNGASGHIFKDTVRGATPTLVANQTSAESSYDAFFTSFDSDGFTLPSNGATNESSSLNYVSWNWKAGGSASSNSNGSITSSVSANTDAGFSIVSFTGNATAGATIGHGLGSVPSLILTKNRDSAYNWHLWTHAFSSYNDTIQLNTTAAKDTGTLLNNTAPTSSLITLGSSAVLNASGEKIIAYVFSEKQNYSKFGSYTGNGNADGTFIYTGFSPAFVMVKRTNSANSWNIKDNRRNNASTSFNINPRNATLLPNDSAADQDANALDFLSNGFKNRSTGNDANNASGTYIYMAFASNPFTTSSGVPATAR